MEPCGTHPGLIWPMPARPRSRQADERGGSVRDGAAWGRSGASQREFQHVVCSEFGTRRSGIAANAGSAVIVEWGEPGFEQAAC